MSKSTDMRAALVHGFSLVEVMVALIITSVGLLGIAKIHALAYSSTTNSSMRSLAAIQGSSLAAAMHANRAYWSTGSAPTSIILGSTATTITVTSSDSTLNTTPDCTSLTTPCTAAQTAAYDLHNWATTLQVVLPGVGAIINCPTSPTPVTCSILFAWTEKTVAINSQGVNGTPTTSVGYQMFVEP